MDTGHSNIKLSCYATPAPLFDTLAQVFTVNESAGNKWVNLKTTEGVDLVFFLEDAPGEVEA